MLKKNKDGRLSILINCEDSIDPDSIKIETWIKSADPESLPALVGTLRNRSVRFEFVPRFPLLAGKEYRVRVVTPRETNDYFVKVPNRKSPRAKVVGVFPADKKIPANLLKFYVHFSTPMLKGDVYKYVKLQKVTGTTRVEVELPFLQIEQELWSRDSLRLTLLLDPGRIKRGLKPREEMGPIFEANETYELVICGEWPSGNGDPLGADFVQTYLTVDEDHQQPDPRKWRLELPQAESTKPLLVHFEKSLDHSMLQRVFRIKSGDDTLDGQWVVAADSRSVRFVPRHPWSKSHYELLIDSNLEDLAGNSVGRPFDVDIFERTESPDDRPIVELRFEID